MFHPFIIRSLIGATTWWAFTTPQRVYLFKWGGSSWVQDGPALVYSFPAAKGNTVLMSVLNNQLYTLASATDKIVIFSYDSTSSTWSTEPTSQTLTVKGNRIHLFPLDDRYYLLDSPSGIVADLFRWNPQVREFDSVATVNIDLPSSNGGGISFKGWASVVLDNGKVISITRNRRRRREHDTI